MAKPFTFFRFDLKVDTQVAEQLLKDIPEKTDRIVRKHAFAIEAAAKIMAPVDTSALKNSIHTRTSKTDGAADAESMATSANPGYGFDPAPKAKKLGIAYVGAGMEYAFYVEFGTSRTPAQPFLGPAVEQQRTAFFRDLENVVKI